MYGACYATYVCFAHTLLRELACGWCTSSWSWLPGSRLVCYGVRFHWLQLMWTVEGLLAPLGIYPKGKLDVGHSLQCTSHGRCRQLPAVCVLVHYMSGSQKMVHVCYTDVYIYVTIIVLACLCVYVYTCTHYVLVFPNSTCIVSKDDTHHSSQNVHISLYQLLLASLPLC